MNNQKILILQLGNIFSYVFLIVFNILCQTVKFNGNTNSSISAKFTPDGWAFTIWTLIFIGLGLFAIYQALPKWRRLQEKEEKLTLREGEVRQTNFVERINILFIINGLINGTWGIVFAYEVFWLSVVFMLILLITLILIYIRLDIGITLSKRDEPLTDNRTSHWYLKYWFVNFPFSLYLGWICVATIANLSIFFYADPIHWRTAQEEWSVVMQTIAFLLGCCFLYFRYDPVPAFVIVWALFAIASKQRDSAAVVSAALPLASVLAIFSLIVTFHRLRLVLKNRSKSVNSGDNMYRE